MMFIIVVKPTTRYQENNLKESIFSYVMRLTVDIIEKSGAGSSPSEAHCGGWVSLDKDAGEPAL